MNKARVTKSVLIAVIVFLAASVAIFIANKLGVNFEGTAWALFPPLVAIVLALVTKEAYSSLLVGITLGAFMVANCGLEGTIDIVVVDGLTSAVADNAGIFLFLVMLGMVVALVNKTGASRAFGEWSEKHIKSRTAAQLASFLLGILIFIDDYFNCLTVGSVMSPVTDSKRISRVKLAYIIDATAAPICMIAPVSSWAAAVSGSVNSESYSGVGLFIRSIPFNFYSLYTLVFVVTIIVMGFDYGKMAEFEIKARENGDLSILDATTENKDEEKNERIIEEDGPVNPRTGKMYDLIIPVFALIFFCIWGLLKIGYQSLEGSGSVIDALSETDAYVGLPWGGLLAIVFIMIYLCARRVISFKDAMECLPKGFVAMVPAITILTLASSLKGVTNMLDAKIFVESIMASIQNLAWILPAVVFVIASLISFATGTSWGTFGILIPIVSAVFPETSPLFFVGISSCLAGAVCGDHCSPISDTTIMSSAGAHCNHINHVETQLPYALSVAVISFVTYLIAGALSNVGLTWIAIPVGAALTVGFLIVMKTVIKKTGKNESFD